MKEKTKVYICEMGIILVAILAISGYVGAKQYNKIQALQQDKQQLIQASRKAYRQVKVLKHKLEIEDKKEMEAWR